jgi:hypothetical protein
MSKRRPVPRSAKVEAAPKSGVLFLPLLLSAAAIIFGIYRAVSLRWISDDAFITMRYVKNFLDGNGLVYNIGERVEGYTHFLWLLLLSAAGWIGFDPVDASVWLGIASFVGILALLVFISYRSRENAANFWLPLAAMLFALNYDNVVWASGGLETSFYTLLLLGAFAVWFYAIFEVRTRLLLSGLCLTLATLTRPDGALFIIAGVVLLFSYDSKRLALQRNIGWFLLPAITIGVPYLLWKYEYYGNLLPLTYYAKSASHSYVGQGLFYVWLYFRVYFLFGLALIASIVLLWKSRRTTTDAREDRGSPTVTAAILALLYLVAFVIRSGGDFMFARFMVPVVPLLLLLVESGWNKVKSTLPRIAFAVLLLGGVFLENELRSGVLFHRNDKGDIVENWGLKGEGSTRGIADERWAYYYRYVWGADGSEGAMDVYSEVGKYLEPFFRGLHVTVAVPGAMNMLAYYANFRTAINEFGLTDSAIAHSATTDTERIGHEKHASEAYLIKRNVNYELVQVTNSPPPQLTAMSVAFEVPTLGVWVLARTITYDEALTHELRDRFRAARNASKFTIYEKVVPAYAANLLPTVSLRDVSSVYDSFQKVYFRPYPDPTLQRAFEDRIAALQDSVQRSR